MVVGMFVIGRIVPAVTFEDISPVFSKALSEMRRGAELLAAAGPGRRGADREQTLATLQRVLAISLHLASLLARLLEEPACRADLAADINTAVYELVKLDIKVHKKKKHTHTLVYQL